MERRKRKAGASQTYFCWPVADVLEEDRAAKQARRKEVTLPKAAEFWLTMETVAEDDSVAGNDPTEMEIQEAAKEILPWLQNAIVRSGKRHDLKEAAKYFLGTCSLFTRDLDMFHGTGRRRCSAALWRNDGGTSQTMFQQLQEFCTKEALKIGKSLDEYYSEEDLFGKLGRLHEEIPVLPAYQGVPSARQVSWGTGDLRPYPLSPY